LGNEREKEGSENKRKEREREKAEFLITRMVPFTYMGRGEENRSL